MNETMSDSCSKHIFRFFFAKKLFWRQMIYCSDGRHSTASGQRLKPFKKGRHSPRRKECPTERCVPDSPPIYWFNQAKPRRWIRQSTGAPSFTIETIGPLKWVIQKC